MNASEISQLMHSFPGADVEETHISYILLTGTYAYKIKKNIKLPFLDFSSLEKRKHDCEEELRLNRRLAPEMYLDIVGIYRQGEAWCLEYEEGELIDYAVKMQRKDPQRLMHRQLENHQVSQGQIITLAEKIALFHAQAPVVSQMIKPSEQAANFNEIEEQRDWIAGHVGIPYAKVVDQALDLSNTFLSKNESLLKQRSKAGLVREVHGDLHTNNIFLYDDPLIFDCIAFNPSFRKLDLLNEVAFLCMDLEAHNALEFSKLFYKHYLQQMQEHGMDEVGHEALFTYYKLYRANVRAKVMIIDARKSKSPDQSLLHSMVTYLLNMQVYANHLHNL